MDEDSELAVLEPLRRWTIGEPLIVGTALSSPNMRHVCFAIDCRIIWTQDMRIHGCDFIKRGPSEPTVVVSRIEPVSAYPTVPDAHLRQQSPL